MKVEIKHRYTGAVLFACDVPDEHSGMAMRHALEKATKALANLSGADLTDADLTDADLTDANLSDADLTCANLTDANLTDADLTRAKNTPLIVYGMRWQVQITGFGQMKIGCQKHDVSAWREFSDAEINNMSSGALEFWNKHKTMLLALCESYKHEAVK